MCAWPRLANGCMRLANWFMCRGGGEWSQANFVYLQRRLRAESDKHKVGGSQMKRRGSAWSRTRWVMKTLACGRNVETPMIFIGYADRLQVFHRSTYIICKIRRKQVFIVARPMMTFTNFRRSKPHPWISEPIRPARHQIMSCTICELEGRLLERASQSPTAH